MQIVTNPVGYVVSSCHGVTLHVLGLDAIDGTPVLDIKPVMREFLPRGEVVQPAWSHELMKNYWAAAIVTSQ